MEPIVFEATEGEVYDTGAVRLPRAVADQPIAITDTPAARVPRPVRHRQPA